jgi:hypothetical protein
MPELLARRDIYPEQIVRHARDGRQLAGALGRVDSLRHEWCKQVVHRARRALQFQLP